MKPSPRRLTLHAGGVLALVVWLVAGILPGMGAPIVHAQSCGAQQSIAIESHADGTIVVTITDLLNVQGLVLSIVAQDSDLRFAYSYPAWLVEAYGGNTHAIQQEIESGRLHDRCPV